MEYYLAVNRNEAITDAIYQRIVEEARQKPQISHASICTECPKETTPLHQKADLCLREADRKKEWELG